MEGIGEIKFGCSNFVTSFEEMVNIYSFNKSTWSIQKPEKVRFYELSVNGQSVTALTMSGFKDFTREESMDQMEYFTSDFPFKVCYDKPRNVKSGNNLLCLDEHDEDEVVHLTSTLQCIDLAMLNTEFQQGLLSILFSRGGIELNGNGELSPQFIIFSGFHNNGEIHV